jgi:hypothetical protein
LEDAKGEFVPNAYEPNNWTIGPDPMPTSVAEVKNTLKESDPCILAEMLNWLGGDWSVVTLFGDYPKDPSKEYAVWRKCARDEGVQKLVRALEGYPKKWIADAAVNAAKSMKTLKASH